MPNLGLPELLIILVVIVIIFGVGRLPEIGGALGRGIKEFRHSSQDDEHETTTSKQLRSETSDPVVTRSESSEKTTLHH